MTEYRYANSGIHIEPFFSMHGLDLWGRDYNYLSVEYNKELLAKYYEEECGFEYKNENDRDQQTDQEFLERLELHDTYFCPIIFNENIALECGLTPFTHNGEGMLALSGTGMNLSPRLGAYQALTHGTIDKCSMLFKQRAYFEQIVGKDITQRVFEAIKA